MEHEDEYSEAMLAAMDLIWGEGFMAPGGEGNVARMAEGLDLHERDVLDIGCGSGRDLKWLRERGFSVTGFERSKGLAALARRHAGGRIEMDRPVSLP